MKKLSTLIICLFSVAVVKAQPVSLKWVKQMGNSTGNIYISSSAADASGNLYSTGVILGKVDVDPGTATTFLTDAGFGDLFVCKMDSSGNFKWAKQIGKESYDQGSSIALDAQGNVYITGFYSMDSTDFDPGTGTSYLSNAGGAKTFILKLDTDGNYIWVKDFGPGSNSPNSITLDASNNILVTGVFGSTVDFDPGAGKTNFTSTTNDIYVLKLNPSGNFIWAKQIDVNITATRSYSIATDGAENIYLTGLLLGTVDFDPGTGVSNLTATSAFGAEYILKLDASGNFKWAKAINGSIDQSKSDRAISVDKAGNCYTTGWFNNTVDFDPDSGVFNLVNSGKKDGSTYLLKLNTSGNFVWAKQIGDPADGNQRTLALDASNNLYVAGTINSTGDFDPGAGIDTLSIKNGSAFVAKYDASGKLIWAVNFSNSTNSGDHSLTLNIDPSGNILTTGVFYGNGDFDPGSGVLNLSSNSSEDIFIHKMSQKSIASIHDLTQTQSNLVVYPNPGNGTFNIQTNGEGEFVILNELGQKIFNFSVKKGIEEVLTVNGLPGGTYFLYGIYSDRSVCKKIVVQR